MSKELKETIKESLRNQCINEGLGKDRMASYIQGRAAQLAVGERPYDKASQNPFSKRKLTFHDKVNAVRGIHRASERLAGQFYVKGGKGRPGGVHRYHPDDKTVYTHKEETEQLDEKLKKGMTVKQVIDDFQKSDDPRFAGDSQEQRRKRAIAAWYKLQREETEQLDETKKFSPGYEKWIAHQVKFRNNPESPMNKNAAAYKKFWAHDPKTGEKIKEIGKKERGEKKAFASAKSEINRLKKQGK